MKYLNKIKYNIKGIRKYYFLLGVILFLIVYCSPKERSNDSIGSVNGIAIPAELFKQQLSKNRVMILNYYSQKYGVSDYKSFWQKKFDYDPTPEDSLKNKSIHDCGIILVQFELAIEKKLIPNFNYAVFLDSLKFINEERKKTVANKKIIYGPIEYSVENYFNLKFDRLIAQLKNILSKNEIDVSETAIHNYYEMSKSKFYIKDSLHNISRYYSFNEVKDLVKSNLIDDKYTQLINNRIKSFEININSDNLKKIIVR